MFLKLIENQVTTVKKIATTQKGGVTLSNFTSSKCQSKIYGICLLPDPFIEKNSFKGNFKGSFFQLIKDYLVESLNSPY